MHAQQQSLKKNTKKKTRRGVSRSIKEKGERRFEKVHREVYWNPCSDCLLHPIRGNAIVVLFKFSKAGKRKRKKKTKYKCLVSVFIPTDNNSLCHSSSSSSSSSLLLLLHVLEADMAVERKLSLLDVLSE